MTAQTRTRFVSAPLIAVLFFLVMPLLYGGEAGALYPPDGTKPDGAGGYMIPADGMCVIGIKLDGTMLVDWSITNARDCVAWTKSADSSVDLVSMGLSCVGGSNAAASCTVASQCPGGACANDKCTKAGVSGNDGYKHAWSTSICYDTINLKGISRVDLDNTDAMCFSKGGTVVTTGKCVAYGWVYNNRKSTCAGGANNGVQCTTNSECPGGACTAPGSTLPVIPGVGLATTDGVQSADGLGFCATSMRMTGTSFTTTATCPSKHNSATLSPGEWPACASSTTGCQTQASYNAGLGWSFASSNCLYAYGVKGIINAAATKADGTTYAAASTQDLTLYTNQGDCLANGFSWDNWLPTTGTSLITGPGPGELVGLPAGAQIRTLDALTSVEDGGGDFYSGTGAVCEKCHSDQSRAYQERNKPGYPKTRHKLAGDAVGEPFQPYFTAAGSAWGLQGVQCAMCHSTAKPAQDDLIQIVPAGVIGPPAAGAPKSATGHNNTEYGTHLIDICYTCHGTPATPLTTNPASVIPVSAGDFALTGNCVGGTNAGASCTLASACPGGGCAGGLAPIANQFLNSPHAGYFGSSTKVDVGNKNFYDSTFEGYVCRTAATQFRNSAPPGDTQANCVAAGLTWYTSTGFGNFCYYNAASCTALNATGQWLTTFDGSAYAWAAAVGGPSGLCVGVGIGSIITTVYQNGVAEKIPNLDSTTNTACTNAGNGSATSGASGFWVKDGETSTGTATDTAQGNCMTCHDVHWAIADTDPEAEAFRRECTTCHENSGPSASGAPQIDLALINHLKTAGTPLVDWLTDPDAACETCHMPDSSATGSFMHLWRISTDAAYTTMGATAANLTPDGSAWVDLDHACGQCHYAPAAPGNRAPIRTKAELAAAAKGMHDAAVVTYATTFTAKMTGLKVDVSAQVYCGDGIACPVFTYDWDWGDGASTLGAGSSSSHTYASYAAKKIGLTVRLGGKVAGTATRSVTPAPPTTTFTAITTGLKVDVTASADCGGPCPTFTYDWNWGDGSAHGTANPDSRTYLVGGTKTITLTLSEGGKTLTMVAKNVKPTSAVTDLPPAASANCTWDASTWTATVVDTSTDTDTSKVQTVTVDWGDKTSRSVATYYGGDLDPRATLTHTYLALPSGSSCVGGGNAGASCTAASQCPGGSCTANTSYKTVLTAIDSALKASVPLTLTCSAPVAPAYFTIDGSVTGPGGAPGLSAASVSVKKQTCLGGSNGGASCTVASQCPGGSCNANTVKTVYTLAGGTFSAGSLKPGNYALTVKKTGYTFDDPTAAITVGPSGSVGTISAK